MHQNTLQVQLAYFENVARRNPRNECLRFALAQVHKELGNDSHADRCYDEGIALENRNWFPKLFWFTAMSGGLAFVVWLLGARWLWLAAIITAVGPIGWLWIRRNRHKWLPQVGLWQRAEMVKSVDMPAALSTPPKRAEGQGEESRSGNLDVKME
jgi:hypothetical protein